MKQKDDSLLALLGQLAGTVTNAAPPAVDSDAVAPDADGDSVGSRWLLSALAPATQPVGGAKAEPALSASPAPAVTAGVAPLLAPWQLGAGSASSSGGTAQWMAALTPLLGALYSLFSRGEEVPSTALSKLLVADKQTYMAGFGSRTSDAVVAANYGEDGLARPLRTVPEGELAALLDSTWFAEHTQDIVAAVRRALLESGELPELLRDF